MRALTPFLVSFSYPVIFTRGVFDVGNVVLPDFFKEMDDRASERKALVFVDAGLVKAQPGFLESLSAFWDACEGLPVLVSPPVVVPGGEAIKNDYRQLMAVLDQALESRLCRHSYVIAIGGGAVLDAVGFAASILHRGLRLIRFPTTVLAQNDAGIGVKTGMNLHGGKNTIGTFAPPSAVINDLALLNSLPDPYWRGGISEAFKVALIKDADFFDWLCSQASALRDRDQEAMEVLVRRCAELHLQHIASSGDPFESGSARPLDFGHWAAHKLESLSSYRVGHGQAVAMGLLMDSCYATAKGWLSKDEFERVWKAISDCGLPLWVRELELRDAQGARCVWSGLEEFREHLGGDLCLTFPDGIGSRREESEVDLDLMEACLQDLQERALQRSHVDAHTL